MFMDTAPATPRTVPRLNRNLAIASGVVTLHVAALWALQTGLLRRAVEVFVPVEVLSEVVEPQRPVAVIPPPAPAPPAHTKEVAVKTRAPAAPSPAQLQPVANPEPVVNTPTAVATPSVPLPPIAAPVAIGAPPAPTLPAPPRIELPSSDAEYLQNPKPAYPALSNRLHEEGTVLVSVFVEADGNVQKVELKKSSGFNRLDRAALAGIQRWRFVPGKRAGIPEAMWVVVPIHWVLD